jgi:hypothetical protein
MKVLFENYPTPEVKTSLLVEQFAKESLTISVQNLPLFNIEKVNETGIVLDKKQLSDFIGALLHIQSKMRK